MTAAPHQEHEAEDEKDGDERRPVDARWGIYAFIVFALAQVAAPLVVQLTAWAAGLEAESSDDLLRTLAVLSGPMVGVIYLSGSFWALGRIRRVPSDMGWRWSGMSGEWRHVLAGLATGVAFVVFELAFAALLNALGFDIDPLEPFEHVLEEPFLVAMLALTVLVTAPFGEEVFYRGYFLSNISAPLRRPRWPSRWPRRARNLWVHQIVVSTLVALVWAVAHGSIELLFQLVVFGVMLGVLRLRTGSLVAPITAHLLNNALAFVLLLARGA